LRLFPGYELIERLPGTCELDQCVDLH